MEYVDFVVVCRGYAAADSTSGGAGIFDFEGALLCEVARFGVSHCYVYL